MRSAIPLSLVAVAFLSFGAFIRADEPAGIDPDLVKKSIDAGVAALKAKQKPSGFWLYGEDRALSVNSFGATALAALALLECGVPADDEAIQKAARAIRYSAVDLTHTYSLALSIIFLDRLGDKEDVAFIKSMTQQLIAGQQRAGTWTYHCPRSAVNMRTELTSSLKARRTAGNGSGKSDKKESNPKTPDFDLDREIEKQVALIISTPRADLDLPISGDNSNTQFALLALWVSRRHGLPVEKSLALVDAHFRSTQISDGGWSYRPPVSGGGRGQFPFGGSTPAMTCAGLLGLAVGNVSTQTSLRAKNTKKDKKPSKEDKADNLKEEPDDKKSAGKDAPRKDLGKDAQVIAGLRFLGAAINGKGPAQLPIDPIVPIGNRGRRQAFDPHYYYFLWSVERVGLAYGLPTIGDKDWFTWGAEQLIDNQGRDGSWYGSGDLGGHCTSLALLFLSHSNLVKDLTSALKGRVADPDKVVLKSGAGTAKPKELDRTPIQGKPVPPPEVVQETPSSATKPTEKAKPGPRKSSDALSLGLKLTDATSTQVDEILDQFRQGKGNDYTESLAKVITRLEAENKKKARQTLADRLSGMTSETLKEKLCDAAPEIRRAASIACAMKEDKARVPDLIPLLEDSDSSVNRAAYAALKSLSGQDFGPAKNADGKEIDKAVKAWKNWWKENGGR